MYTIESKEESQFGCSTRCFLSTGTRTKMNIKCCRSQGDFLLIRSLITGLKNILSSCYVSHSLTQLQYYLNFIVSIFNHSEFDVYASKFLILHGNCVKTAVTEWITVHFCGNVKYEILTRTHQLVFSSSFFIIVDVVFISLFFLFSTIFFFNFFEISLVKKLIMQLFFFLFLFIYFLSFD